MEKNLTKKINTNNLKPIVITKRDKAVLAKVADYRLLTTEQLYRLCFPSLSRARKRLYRLWQHGYLKRVVRPTRIGEGSSMYLYLPSRMGLRLISSNHYIGRISNRRSVFYTDHTLAVNNFRICLELAARNSNIISLIEWKQGKNLLMKASVNYKGILKQIPIIPDAYFTLKYNERVIYYFLEIDRGTTDLKRIALKCRGYLNIWQENIAQAKFGIRSFRVLYITNTEKRLSNMLNQLEKLKTNHRRLDLIMMADTKAFSLAKPNRIFEPIWNILDREGNIREVGLLPTTFFQSSQRRAENHHCAVQNPIPVNGNPGPGG